MAVPVMTLLTEPIMKGVLAVISAPEDTPRPDDGHGSSRDATGEQMPPIDHVTA